MEFVGEDITKRVFESVMQDKAPESHDFFQPLNEMDPMIRPKKLPFEPPKFNFKIFNLAGVGADPQDAVQYIDIMNKIVSGEYTHSQSETYHSKDGDIRVFLRWYEWPKGKNPYSEIPVKDGLETQPVDKKKPKKVPIKKDPTEDGFIIPDPEVTM